MSVFYNFLKKNTIDGLQASWQISKITLPVLFVIEILIFFDILKFFIHFIAPIFSFLKLPPEFSIFYIAGIFGGIYSAISSLIIYDAYSQYTVAQVSVFAIMILISHAIPLEAKISKVLGLSYIYSVFLRISLSLILGLLVSKFLYTFSLLEQNIDIIKISIEYSNNNSFINLFIKPIEACVNMIIVIFIVYFVLDILKIIGAMYIFEKLLKPLFHLLKINKNLTEPMLVGICIGLSYGSILLKKQMNQQHIKHNEKKKVVFFLNLCHAIIEDTLLVLLIGADVFIVLFIRLIFVCLIIIIFNSAGTFNDKNIIKNYIQQLKM